MILLLVSARLPPIRVGSTIIPVYGLFVLLRTFPGEKRLRKLAGPFSNLWPLLSPGNFPCVILVGPGVRFVVV